MAENQVRSRYVSFDPFVAVAIARKQKARSTINALYNAQPALCFAAAQRSKFKNHPVITGGRAEHQIMALRVLGILMVYEDNNVVISRLLRATNPRVYDKIKDAESVISLATAYVEFVDEPSDDFFDDMLLLYVYSKHLHKEIDITEFEKCIGEVCAHQEDFKRIIVDSDIRRSAKKFFGCSEIVGADALEEAANDAGVNLNEYFLSGEEAGIFINAYTRGITLTERDLAMAHATGMPWQSALIRMLMLAIQRDKKFCLELAGQEGKAQKAIAQQEQKKAEHEKQQLENVLKKNEAARLKLQTQIAMLQREIEKQNAEISQMKSEQQEISALREALYAAQEQDEGVVNVGIQVREIPNGVICIGGTSAWARAMKERISAVSFYPVGVSIQNSTVRNASEVWFRADYISHSDFYRVINITRQCGIPVHYFSGQNLDRSEMEIRQVQ